MGLETGSVRNPEDRKELIPPSSVLKGQSQQGKKAKKKWTLKAPMPTCTHQVEGSPEQGLYLDCSHGWYHDCTPDSCWVGGYDCSVLACSMESFREGEQV